MAEYRGEGRPIIALYKIQGEEGLIKIKSLLEFHK